MIWYGTMHTRTGQGITTFARTLGGCQVAELDIRHCKLVSESKQQQPIEGHVCMDVSRMKLAVRYLCVALLCM
jgi:hypothetical protein